MQIFAETDRLILREIVPSDDKGLFLLDSDPEVHRYLGNNPVKDIKRIREVIEFIRQQYIENRIGRWAVIEKDSNEFIGWAGLKLVKELTNGHINHYDLGYRLRKEYWGKGYATESGQACLDYGFNILKLTEIYAAADVNNAGSNNVLNKLGFKFVNTFDYDGKLHNWMVRVKSEQCRFADLRI